MGRAGTVRLAQIDYHRRWVGRPVLNLEAATGARVAFVTRYSSAILPTPDVVLQENDVLHLLMTADRSAEIERILTAAPTAEED